MAGLKKFLKVSHVTFPGIFFFLIIFFGCATKEAVKSVSDEEVLKERVTAYWNYRIKGELEKAYDYEYPLAKRPLTTYIAQHESPLLKYKSFELKSIMKNAGDVADVELTILPVVKVPGAKAFEHTLTITERWVKVDEVWYRMGASSKNGVTHEKEKGGDVQE